MDSLLLPAIGLGVGFGIAAGIVRKLRENALNKELRAQLEARDAAFKQGMCKGRQWLADFIAECEHARDKRDTYLQYKSHPARKSAEIVKEVKREKRDLTARTKFLEYQLKSYEEYFPLLEEYRDIILDERVILARNADNVSEVEGVDPAQTFLNRDEWEKLSSAQRNQLALDRYVSRTKNDWEIGRYYERYIGYLKEKEGWMVIYHGALQGFEDLGRDLICTKNNQVEIVQAKCWSKSKTIHEKHIFQLFGSTIHYRLENPKSEVSAILVTTTSLSNVAKEVARLLQIKVEHLSLPDSYPMIKCNVNRSTREKIYHLPFDQQYDRTQVHLDDERYVSTVEEAEDRGFRRAWKWHGSQSGKAE